MCIRIMSDKQFRWHVVDIIELECNVLNSGVSSYDFHDANMSLCRLLRKCELRRQFNHCYS